MIQMTYPESRQVTEEMVIMWAHDILVNTAWRNVPEPERSNDDAMERLGASIDRPNLQDAIALLEDTGECTFRHK